MGAAWEYYTEVGPVGGAHWDQLGVDGWELVGFIKDGPDLGICRSVFKRPKRVAAWSDEAAAFERTDRLERSWPLTSGTA